MTITEKTFLKKAKIVVKDEVNCIIAGLHPDQVDYFYNEHGVKTEYYYHTTAYQLGKWDGYIRFFDKLGNTFNYLLPEIVPKIEAFGYKMELEDRRSGQIVTIDPIDADFFSNFTDPKTNQPWKLRPYQVDAVNAATQDGNGIILAGTGAGKTIMNACIATLYGSKGLRSITIVPNGSLIRKTKKDFMFFNLDTGEYSGDNKDLKHQHVVSTWQALQNAPHLLKHFDVIVVDECHGSKALVLKKLLTEYANNIVYRFGLTATMPTAKSDRMSIYVSLGVPKYEIPAHLLIEQGWLSKLNISIMQLDDKTHIDQYVDKDFKIDYDLEIDYLSKLQPRLGWIAEFLAEKANTGKGNVLCLVNNIPVGKRLLKLLPGSVFIYGKDDVEVREQVYELFSKEDNLLIIATVQIAGVGIDIDRIFNLVFIDGGKSFIRTIQSIGRGLRKGKDKDHVDVVDICGNLKYSVKHLRERVKFYKGAQYPYKKYLVQYQKEKQDVDI